MKPKMVVRVNGNSLIGYGHVIRCAALAEKLRDHYSLNFVCTDPDSFVKEQLAPLGDLTVLPPVYQYAPDDDRSKKELPFDLKGIVDEHTTTVLDGYRFGEEFRKSVRSTGAKLVCIDDSSGGSCQAHMIINPSPLVSADAYDALPHTVFCLGLDYALLRREFYAVSSGCMREGILIAIGGTDLPGLTSQLAGKLLSETKEKITAVVTSGFSTPHMDRLLHLEDTHSQFTMRANLTASEMVILMDQMKWAIVPASGILVEALCRGLQCAAGFYADNQRNNYEWFSAHGYIQPLGYLPALAASKDPINLQHVRQTLRLTDNRNTFVNAFQQLACA